MNFHGSILRNQDFYRRWSMVETFHGPWYYSPPKNAPEPGTQIDLLIDRKDASVNLCEMKFSESEFTVDADYAKNLRQKKEVFQNVTKTRKTIFITMISIMQFIT